MAKLWGGRFKQTGAKLLDEFNASLSFDKKLYKEDILGSIAHIGMLAKCGIVGTQESQKIIDGLKIVEKEIDEDKFVFEIGDEDIHMAVEKRLTQIVGEVGKKLHTARSRNDQVALDFRLYVQKSSKKLMELLLNLENSLLSVAKENIDTLLPGMTHLQHAQPINLAFHMMAYASMFKRDFERFESSFKRNNFSPIGCAALAGTVYPTDRFMVATTLGFDAPTTNCLDTVSDRDFALEILFNIATMFVHISRFAEELILWSSYEFKFITMSDNFSTGSSIMPQKKNPDVAELLRGKTGRVYGNLISLLTVMKSLPLAYNKDMQEDKEGVFDSVETAIASLEILAPMIETMTINKDKMLKACRVGHLSATDLADYLVKKLDIPFRDAHEITGKAVAYAEECGKDLSELSVLELQKIHPAIESGVLESLNIENSMNARNSYGGTSKESSVKQIEYFEKWLEETAGN